MGLYEAGQQFPGTDRLSMGVHPHMERVLRSGRTDALIWEGDRLSSGKLFRLANELGHDLAVYLISCPADMLASRRAAERDQSDTFISRCRTKIANLLAEFPYTEVSMTRPEDAGDLARLIYGTRT